MPKLRDIAGALQAYRGRYEFLDAFADDVDEIRDRTLSDVATLVQGGTQPMVAVPIQGGPLLVQLFPEQGVARFRLGQGQAGNGNHALTGATIGGAVGAALSSASNAKEGLLGGLILGMLVGGLAGAAAGPVERVLALQFDPAVANWRLYDGPLLRWAKRTLQPAA